MPYEVPGGVLCSAADGCSGGEAPPVVGRIVSRRCSDDTADVS